MRDWDCLKFLLFYYLIYKDYITYEGLRHNSFVNFIKSIFFWITLPMRDWDIRFPSMSSTKNIGLHYLWGIETYLLLYWLMLRQGLHYLWGIETRRLQGLYVKLILDYITYEGLRLNYNSFTCTIDSIWITLPMRDWDQSPVTNFPSPS